MNLGDVTDWAMRKALSACEEARLDPPADLPLMKCVFCDGRGHYKAPHCLDSKCDRQKRCACKCPNCAYVGCDVCDETGEMVQED